MGLSCKRISIVDAVTNGVPRILLVKCRVTKVKPLPLWWLVVFGEIWWYFEYTQCSVLRVASGGGRPGNNVVLGIEPESPACNS